MSQPSDNFLSRTTPQMMITVNATTLVTDVTSPPTSVTVQWLRIILLPIIVAVGTVGNGLSLLVLMRRRMRTTSVYHYLLMLTCLDTVVLYLSAMKTWIREVSDFELLHISSASCKLCVFLLLVSWYASSWLIVLMTIDRFVVVWFPFKASNICTVPRARLASVIMLVLAILANIHVFWTFSLSQIDGVYKCAEELNLEFVKGHHFETLKMTLYCFLPFAVVLILNSAIIHKLRTSRGRMLDRDDSSPGVPSSPHRSQHVHRKVTYMLLTVSFSWFVLTAPFSLQIFLPKVFSNALYKTIIFFLMYINHSVNFFLYCLTGKKFRDEVKRLCCRRESKNDPHRQHFATTN